MSVLDSSDFKLASCGDSVKIWKLSTFSLENEFKPPITSNDFSSVSWNKEGDKLVSVPSRSSSLIISELQRQSLYNSEIKIGAKLSCATFVNETSSRYLALGTSSGEVLYWDTHHSKIERTLCSKDSEITCLVNGSNKHLAIGTLRGDVYIYNLMTHISSGPLKVENSDSIKEIDFRKAKLLSSSDDGNVNFWDVNTNKLIYGFENCHESPGSGVKFMHPSLSTAVSVGLDKKAVLLDLRMKKCVSKYSCNQPLRCVEGLRDLTNFLVGGSNGDVFEFHISYPKEKKVLKVHNGPVRCLAINEFKKEKNSTSSTLSSKENTLVTKSPEGKENISDKQEQSRSHNSNSSIFTYGSPVTISYSDPFNKESQSPGMLMPDYDSENISNQGDSENANGSTRLEEPPKNMVEDLIQYLATNAVSEEKQKLKPPSPKKCTKEYKQEDMEIIIRLVTELIKEAKFEMHLDQVHLFTQMVKQFIDLKEEVKELRHTCEANAEMQEELYRLREENYQLKLARY